MRLWDRMVFPTRDCFSPVISMHSQNKPRTQVRGLWWKASPLTIRGLARTDKGAVLERHQVCVEFANEVIGMSKLDGVRGFFNALSSIVEWQLRSSLEGRIARDLNNAVRTNNREKYSHIRDSLSGTITESILFSALRAKIVENDDVAGVATILAWDYAAGASSIYPRSLADFAKSALTQKKTGVLSHLLDHHKDELPPDMILDHMTRLYKFNRSAWDASLDLRNLLAGKGYDVDGIETTALAIEKRRRDFKPSTWEERKRLRAARDKDMQP